MMPAVAASPEGGLLVLAVTLPVVGMLALIACDGRHAPKLNFVILPLGLAVAIAIAAVVWRGARPLTYVLGGWQPPLGIVLRADGVAAAMVLVTAVIICATGLFAGRQYRPAAGQPETRTSLVFWVFLMAVWAGLNTVFLGNDLFNLYVALELLTFGAVPLVSLEGRVETLKAALRYLIFALLGSVLYLLGTALLYGAHGTLDIAMLAGVARAAPVTWIALALMTVGLVAKTALFPLYLWLPPAHAGAPAAASAVLSALVVKGSFFLIVRLWFDVMPGGPGPAGAQFLAALGASAILFGSLLALLQPRLKLLIAYSTVAQIGYLFLIFPLAAGGAAAATAWTGGFLQLFSHAFAKAGMFMAAGLIAEALGHDRIAGLGGAARLAPIALLAFGLGGLSLMGIPPSGGFAAKWLILSAALAEGQWWWAVVVLIGGLLAGGYVLRVLAPALTPAVTPHDAKAQVPRGRQAVALGLVVCAFLIGLAPLGPLDFLLIGRPVGWQAGP
jgi:multicomponent Na+:H+ antiporter subunit D